MSYIYNGTNGTTHPNGSTPEGGTATLDEQVTRWTQLGVYLTWEDLDEEDRLERILAEPDPEEWLIDQALTTLANFRKIKARWAKIQARYRRIGGDTRILREAVDGLLAEEAKARTGPQTKRQPELLLTCLADVTPQAVEWEWYPYIALGTICMVDGDPGIGKSLLLLQLAANISKGYPFPDQDGKLTADKRDPANVLILTREDSLSRTIRPRLDKDGADASRIYATASWIDANDKEQVFTLQHLPLLEDKLQLLQPRLVILDPIQSFFGDADMHRANQTRPLLDALGRLAERYNCAIVCIRHPAKNGEGIGKALHRGLGSVDIVGAARTALFVEQYPGDETRALLAQTKSNLGPLGRTQIFSKREGAFEWTGQVTRLSAETLAGSGRGPNHTAFLEAVLWLEQRLEGGLAWPAKDIETEAEREDISLGLLRQAKKTLKVTSSQNKGEAHDGWTWRLAPLPPLPRPPGTTPPTDSTEVTDSTDSTDTPDLKTMTYEGLSLPRWCEGGGQPPPVSDESDGADVSDESVSGVLIESFFPSSLPSSSPTSAPVTPANLSPVEEDISCCVFCHGTVFWTNAGGQRICSRCHPRRAGGGV